MGGIAGPIEGMGGGVANAPGGSGEVLGGALGNPIGYMCGCAVGVGGVLGPKNDPAQLIKPDDFSSGTGGGTANAGCFGEPGVTRRGTGDGPAFFGVCPKSIPFLAIVLLRSSACGLGPPNVCFGGPVFAGVLLGVIRLRDAISGGVAFV